MGSATWKELKFKKIQEEGEDQEKKKPIGLATP